VQHQHSLGVGGVNTALKGGVYGFTFVSKPTLVESEGPIGNLCRGPDDLGILARHFDRIRNAASQKVEVDHSSDDVVLKRCSGSARILVDLDVHSVRVEKEHAVRTSGTMVEVNGVVSIQVCVVGNSIGIPGPKGAGIVVGR